MAVAAWQSPSLMRRCARGLAFGIATAASCPPLSCLLLSCSLLVNTDALVDGSDAGPHEAGLDAADAQTAMDSGLDGGAIGDAAPDGPWCATQPAHTHCFDFDTVGTAGVGWDSNTISPGGAVALDTTTYDSPPASMRSGVADGTVQGGTYAVLVEDIPASATTVTCAFDVQTDRGSGSTYPANASLFELYYGSNWIIVGVSSQGPTSHGICRLRAATSRAATPSSRSLRAPRAGRGSG